MVDPNAQYFHPSLALRQVTVFEDWMWYRIESCIVLVNEKTGIAEFLDLSIGLKPEGIIEYVLKKSNPTVNLVASF